MWAASRHHPTAAFAGSLEAVVSWHARTVHLKWRCEPSVA